MPYQTFIGSQAQLLSNVSNLTGMYQAGDILTVKSRIYQSSPILGGQPFFLTTMGPSDDSTPDITVTYDKFELVPTESVSDLPKHSPHIKD